MSAQGPIPPEVGAIIESAVAADRQWFVDHPFVNVRYRRIAPGEFWPLRFPNNCRVEVTRVGDDVRARRTLTRSTGSYDADVAALVEEHATDTFVGVHLFDVSEVER